MAEADDQLLDVERSLWAAADTLRGSVDAGEYQHVVLGLLCLRHALARSPGVSATWDDVVTSAGSASLPKQISRAIRAVEHAKPELKGAFASYHRTLDARRLSELVLLIDAIEEHSGSARDVYGRIWEYFLGRFASEAGRNGEFYTPKCVVELLVDLVEPSTGRAYDPCCGSGGMFIQAQRRDASRGLGELQLFGQELNERTWKLARINLALHGLSADLGDRSADTLHNDLHEGLEADFVLANPPFNMSDWGAGLLTEDRRWAFGVPPTANANFAWLEHIAHHLSERGRGAVVLANGSLTSNQWGERSIRMELLRANLVDAIVALPPKLFFTTPVPACVWVLDRGRAGVAKREPLDVLMVDATSFGKAVTRRHSIIEESARKTLASTYLGWRNEERAFVHDPGIARSVSFEEIEAADFSLLPSRYTAPSEVATPADLDERLAELAGDLRELLAESAALDGELIPILQSLRPGS
jgi:type I restriction enzyme M protein